MQEACIYVPVFGILLVHGNVGLSPQSRLTVTLLSGVIAMLGCCNPIVNLAPRQGRGSSTHRVSVCLSVHLSVCYRSSGRYGYLTSQTKVSTESARHNKHN